MKGKSISTEPKQIIDDFESLIEKVSHVPISLTQGSELSPKLTRKEQSNNSSMDKDSITKINVYKMKPVNV